jgi:hypothetical protein
MDVELRDHTPEVIRIAALDAEAARKLRDESIVDVLRPEALLERHLEQPGGMTPLHDGIFLHGMMEPQHHLTSGRLKGPNDSRARVRIPMSAEE